MPTRTETTAATRRALLDAASALLDAGGPDAVTLREVGSRAGVSRSAPYRHFVDKEQLLTALATRAWDDVGDGLAALVGDAEASPEHLLRAALHALLELGRARPHLYRLMFTTPAGDPTAAVRAAERAQDLFLRLVTEVVGIARSPQHGGLLLTSAHGIIGLEVSGHLAYDKWRSSAEDLVDLLLGLLPTTP